MIYAVNKITKVHRIDDEGTKAADEKWVRADADGWIPHDGRECPLPDGASHDVKFRDALVLDALQNPVSWYWHHKGEGADIIAYRPILDAKPEPPEWNGEGLPPINHRCEMARAGEKHTPGVLRYIGDDLVVWQFENGVEIALRPEHCDFRPLRTAEDRAVEEMLRDCPYPGSKCTEIDCRALYRAGYRKSD